MMFKLCCCNEFISDHHSGSTPNFSVVGQCPISRCASRQMLVLLSWKVRPLMYYQAINSVTEASSYIGMRFKDHLQGRFPAGEHFKLPVCVFRLVFISRSVPVNSRPLLFRISWDHMNSVCCRVVYSLDYLPLE